MGKLVETLLEGLEQHFAFEERVARVMAEAEREHGQPCSVFYQRVPDGEIQPLDTAFLVIIGSIHKKRQERLEIGGKA